MTSDDDFDLDDLKSAITSANPRPDPATREAHLRLASENFDNLHDSRQGSPEAARHTDNAPQRGFIAGVTKMLSAFTTKGGLTATTAMVACGVLFFTPQGQEIWQGGLPQQAPTSGIESELDTAVATILENVTVGAIGTTTPRGQDLAFEAAPENGIGLDVIAPAPRTSSRQVATGLVAQPDMVVAATPNTETFANEAPNGLSITADSPVSTFSIDVDTASYAILRQSLNAGQLPPAQAVRIEEMINYFPYAYTSPDRDAGLPFQPNITVTDTPWNPDTQLVHIGIQGVMPDITERPPLNLVFLIDTSGSMDQPNKLPLLRQSFMLMLDQLRPEDEVAIVTYAGSAGMALPPTRAEDRSAITAALNNLRAGGGTNGQGGLTQAYAVAGQMTDDGEVSRVILATDGDFNVGVSSVEGLTDYIERQRDSGTYLSVLGFGRGNLDDATMQALAQNGNGTAAYIDTLNEAQKVLVDQLTGALFAIAGDVKVQVEFNPATVAEYRLIGYETRSLAREDFNNDAVDAGELGAGHSVTAIYEVTPTGSPAVRNDPLRYEDNTVAADTSGELGFLRLRYKNPGEDTSQLIETPILQGDAPATNDIAFSIAIAGFGELLRGSDYTGDWAYDEAIELALEGRGEDTFGYRAEAIQLMRLANSLSSN